MAMRRTARDPTLAEMHPLRSTGLRRDACRDGALVALSLTAEALAEDCSRAAIVVTARAGAGRVYRAC